MHAIQHGKFGPGGSTRARPRGVARGANRGRTNRTCNAAPTGEFLGAGEAGLELWFSGGHVYSHPPSGGCGSHICRFATPNRLLKQDRRTAARQPTRTQAR